jgi:serine/threonine protein kinase
LWIQEQCYGLAGAVSTIHHYLTTSRTSIFRDEYSPQPETSHALEQECGLINDPKGSLTLKGRHGDIKPANILWYPAQHGLGILRLSDFGTAHFSSTNGISSHESDTIPSSRPYRSPESVLPDGEISGQCDVWALGCVFLEFVCWYAGGCELLKRFEGERAFGHESASFCCLKYNRLDAPLRMEVKQPVRKVSDSRL